MKASLTSRTLRTAGLIFFLVCTVAIQASTPLRLDYACIFPAQRQPDAAATLHVLIPHAATFALRIVCAPPVGHFRDVAGASAKVTDIVLTSATDVAFRNPEGFTRVTLPTPGIYEMRVIPVGSSEQEIRCQIYLEEEIGAADDKNTSPDRPNDLADDRQTATPWQTQTLPEQTRTDPVAVVAPITPITPIAPVAPIAQIGQGPESRALPGAPEIPSFVAPLTGPESVRRTVPAIDPATVQQQNAISEPVPIPSSEPITQPTVPANADLDTTPADLENRVGAQSPTTVATVDFPQFILNSPAEDAYADPFQGFEVQALTPIPVGIPPVGSWLIVNELDAQGQYRKVDGTAFAIGGDRAKFLPWRMRPGAVYHLQICPKGPSTPSQTLILRSLPEIRGNLVDEGERYLLRFEWSLAEDLLGADHGQVLRLSNTEIVIDNDKSQFLRIFLRPDMPPFGHEAGFSYRAEPCRFQLDLRKSQLPETWQDLRVRLLAKVGSGSTPLEILRLHLGQTPVGDDEEVPDWANEPAVEENGTITELPPNETPSTNTEDATAIATTAAGHSTAVSDAGSMALPTDIPASGQPDHEAHEAHESSVPVADPLAGHAAISPSIPEPSTTVRDFSQGVSLPTVVKMADPGVTASIAWQRSFPVEEQGRTDYRSWPKSVIWDENGAVWVTDCQTRRIMRFREDGMLLLSFGEEGKQAGQFGFPVEIGLASETVLVADTAQHRVHVFSLNGRFQRHIGVWGTHAGEIDLPYALVTGPDCFWLADHGNSALMRFSYAGVFQGNIAQKGERAGFLNGPVSVRAFNNELWTLEVDGRVQWFSMEGKQLGAFQVNCKEPGAFVVDPWGMPWLADSSLEHVQRFDRKGKILLTVKADAAGIQTWIPTGVAVRADGLAAVSDGRNCSLHIFRLK